MSGNVTKEGIKLNFEWFKRVGIAGFQNFDAGLNSPQIVEKRLVYMTPQVEGRLQIRRHPCRRVRTGNGHCQFSRMERSG